MILTNQYKIDNKEVGSKNLLTPKPDNLKVLIKTKTSLSVTWRIGLNQLFLFTQYL